MYDWENPKYMTYRDRVNPLFVSPKELSELHDLIDKSNFNEMQVHVREYLDGHNRLVLVVQKQPFPEKLILVCELCYFIKFDIYANSQDRLNIKLGKFKKDKCFIVSFGKSKIKCGLIDFRAFNYPENIY